MGERDAAFKSIRKPRINEFGNTSKDKEERESHSGNPHDCDIGSNAFITHFYIRWAGL